MERTRRTRNRWQGESDEQYHRPAKGSISSGIRGRTTTRRQRVLDDIKERQRTNESDSERRSQNALTTAPAAASNAAKRRTGKRQLSAGDQNTTASNEWRQPSDRGTTDGESIADTNLDTSAEDGQLESLHAIDQQSETAEMDSILKTIYYDVTHVAGFASVRKLWDAVKGDNSFTLKYVKKWLSTQEAYNLFKPARVTFPRPRIHINGADAVWEMDLMIMRHIFTVDDSSDAMALPEANDGYSYVLLVIDAFSKYLWAQPCKAKTSYDVAKAFEKVLLDAAPRTPASLRSDMGGEFKGRAFARIAERLGIPHYWAYSDLKAVFVERSVKTVKARLRKHIDYTGQMRYIDILSDVIDTYNATVHSSIGMAPKDVQPEDRDVIEYHAYLNDANPRPKPKKYTFAIGETVVISKLRGSFKREYDEKYSHEIFRIKTRYKRSGTPVYNLTEYDGSQIKGTFYEEELQSVTVTPDRRYTVETILRRRGNQALIKWRGWDRKYAQWQPISTIATKA